MTQTDKTDKTILVVLTLSGVLIHILFNGQYGFHRDELDILMNARQLDWGYIAYPPFTPFIARIGLELFGSSLRGLRVFPAIAQGIVILLTGLMVRDLGGKRGAQVMAAVAVFIAPVALMAGTLIQYFVFDYLWWVLVAFFTVRLLASEDPRYWLGIGAGIGFGMMTKYTMAFWAAALVGAVLLTPMRKYLRSRWLWIGALLALLIFLPNLIWQIQHDFVAFRYLSAIHARDVEWGRASDFLPKQLYESTNPFTLPLWVIGFAACMFGASMKRFRLLAWMFVLAFALVLIAQGRSYYIAPAYVPLLAAGCTVFENRLLTAAASTRRLAWGIVAAVLTVGGLAALVLVKPIAPINSPLWDISSGVNREVVEMIGWQDLTAQVGKIYRSIPENERRATVILAGNYGEAGALDLYGREGGLPRIISGANSLWYRGYGEPAPETAIVVGFESAYAQNFFRQCDYAGNVENRYHVANEETSRHSSLYVCRQPRQSWSEMWKGMQWFQ